MSQSYVWRYGATVYGIKKSARKMQMHIAGNRFASIGEEKPNTAPDPAKAIELARAWTAQNMREVRSVTATATKWVETFDGSMSETQPFGGEGWNRKWEIDALGVEVRA